MKDVLLVSVAEGSSRYVICDDAEDTLKKLTAALTADDTADIRKNILNEKILKNQLIPLLLTVKFETQPRLLSIVIR